MKQSNGVIIWKGQSSLDGQNIVVIATGLTTKSSNMKTGDMLQTWVLLDDIKPYEAVKTGADYGICGNCKHRGTIVDGKVVDRTCYVTVFQAPTSIWNAYKRGSYEDWTDRDLSIIGFDRNVRIGAYGDPACIPVSVWQELTKDSNTTTGYTHQWTDKANDALKYLTMASADTLEEMKQAVAMGWRTFRVKVEGTKKADNESVCPATTVGLNCADCGACKGLKGLNPLKGSIVIDVHGRGAKAFAL